MKAIAGIQSLGPSGMAESGMSGASGYPALLRFEANALDAGPEAVARYFGGSGYRFSDKTRQRMEAAVSLGGSLITPQAVAAAFPAKRLPEAARIHLTERFHQPDGTDADLSEATVFIATLGPGLEAECRRLGAAGRIYEATLLDAVGVTLLESLADAIRAWASGKAQEKGLCWGGQVSPGTCRAPLSLQTWIFSALPASAIGVNLNPSLVMEPVKSLSGFLLMTDRPEAGANAYKCARCGLRTCQFRIPGPPSPEPAAVLHEED